MRWDNTLYGASSETTDVLSLPAGACATIPKLTLLLEDLSLGVAVPYSGTLYDVPHEYHPVSQDEQDALKTFSVDLCAITANRANSLENHIETLSWDGDKYAPDDEWDDSLDFAFLPWLTDFLPSTHHTSPMGMARELFAMTSALAPSQFFLSL
jgi:hypothetical protein